MSNGYIKRTCDENLKLKLETFGAVHIIGPKWCGKTTTAKQFAKSYIEMQDPDKREMYLETAKIKPSNLLIGENPRLIDEWQIAPSLGCRQSFRRQKKRIGTLYSYGFKFDRQDFDNAYRNGANRHSEYVSDEPF